MLATDTASATYGNLDGFTLCGARTYIILPTTYPFITISGDDLTLVSTDPAEETSAPLTITIVATLDNYPVAAFGTFSVEIVC